jgi:serine/threonine-protein kinase
MKTCPECQAQAEPAARFCLDCGHAFGEASPDAADPWRGRIIAGRFQIVRKLGDGGMGEVFLAEQQPMGRLVALKILRAALADDPQQVERFKREAQAASRLKHPNTIIVHDFGQGQDGVVFLAMEYLEGRTLAHLLDEEGRLEPRRAVRMMAQICGSLHEAHGHGVVHRDLKPENIFLTERGGQVDFVKVLDFGIAKIRDNQAGGKLETITRQGAIFGTPQYMSPEQIKGADLDARSDVYALGVMLYQMLSGALPFKAATAVEMLTKHLAESPAPLSVDTADAATMARLEATALRALSKDRTHRQPTAQTFLDELELAIGAPVAGPLTTTTGPTPPSSGSPPRRSPARWPLAVVGLAIAAGIGAAVFFARPETPPDPRPDAGHPASVSTSPPAPSAAPTAPPTEAPSAAPTAPPTQAPSGAPTAPPTVAPTAPPTRPPAPPTAAPTRPARDEKRPAKLFIRSATPGVKIYIDGRPKGTTPLVNFEVPAGVHNVTGVLDGRRESVDVDVPPGAVKNIKLKL